MAVSAPKQPIPAAIDTPIAKTVAGKKFIEAAGHTTQSFGLGRIIGHIFALLYLSPKPLCLDEIVNELGVSKASVSLAVRQLERWSAVRRIWVKGDRKDYYEAETDFNSVLRNGLVAVLRKKFQTAGQQIANVESSLNEGLERGEDGHRNSIQVVAERVKKAREFQKRVESLLNSPLLDELL